ncbi:serine/threonine-protein kinase [Lysinibacillus xylanilyticus]|uniref:serine/threonine-protein kinase n=1 Tax=Lysinibacillus xylanilyticus TaxID=582475 RepID=UPI003D08772F
MSFIDQHQDYKSYKHESYYLSELPYNFNREFNNFIHSILMKGDPEDLIYNAWSLQNRLAALARTSASERGPYNFLLEEINRVLGVIIKKGFHSVMDAIGILLSVTGEEDEINSFLAEQGLGYNCSIFMGEVDWAYEEGVIDASKIPPSILDKLTNKGKRKTGYFGTVTQYEDIEKHIKYALKRLKPDYNDNKVYKNRFNREIRILNELMELKHPNIIPIIDSRFDEDSNDYWYLMPYAADNLYDYIKKYNRTLDTESRLSIFSQILDAIELAHSKDILHRDLSAHNVLLNGENGVWVSDFGLGKDYNHLSNQGYSSVQGYGNLLFVAPEQQEKLDNATKKSDVFSLGKLLYFILTGRDPRITSNSPKFSSLINKATLHDPSGRYKDAIHLKEEFLKYKSLYEKAKASTIRTVSDLVLQKNNFSWMEFHEIALKAESHEHIYYDFLDPIAEVLKSKEKIESYISTVGADIEKFIEIYAEKLQECYKTTGWPFTSKTSFAYFLIRLYSSTTEYPSSRLILLKELWYLADDSDQWSVQDIVVELINLNKIPENIADEFAIFIMESGRYFRKLDGVKKTGVSHSLKNAIIHLKEENNE